MTDTGSLRPHDFESRVGDSFVVRLDGADGGRFELIAVERESTGGDRVEAFSVLFRGVGVPAFDQQTVALAHAEMGELDVFVVAVDEDDLGRRYEAVFTRLVE